jgi:hypothetical protein
MYKKSISSLFLIVVISAAYYAQSSTSGLKVVAGEGWGAVSLNAKRSRVEAALGKGKNLSKFNDVYFLDFESSGVQVSFNNSDDTVHAIFFYNGQRLDRNFAVFKGEIDKSLTWKASVDDVLRAYGKPEKDFGGSDSNGTWRRLAFKGIDFRFENKKLVRIGIPGN